MIYTYHVTTGKAATAAAVAESETDTPPEPVVVPSESIFMQIVEFLLDTKATPVKPQSTPFLLITFCEFSLLILVLITMQFNCTFVFIRRQYFESLTDKQTTSHCVYLRFEKHSLLAQSSPTSRLS